MSLNRNQRRLIGQFLANLGLGIILAFTIGPLLSPVEKIPYPFLAAWGIFWGMIFLWWGTSLSR